MYRTVKLICIYILLVLIMTAVGCESGEPSQPSVSPAAEENNNNVPENDPVGSGEHTKLSTDSGTYTGRIDDLSIEIAVSGVPEEKAYRAFELSDELRESFDSYGFESGEQVLFEYEPGVDGKRGVIMKIEKIVN